MKTRHQIYYQKHKDKLKADAKTYRDTHVEELKEYRSKTKQQQRENSKNYKQSEKGKETRNVWELNNQDKIKKYDRDYKDKIKQECLEQYGLECICCREDIFRFLTLDHINNGGREHRKSIRNNSIYGWAKNHGFPPIFQTMCIKCNCSKGKVNSNNKCQHSQDKTILSNAQIKVFIHYGMKCACPKCNEDNLGLMTVDHINNDGAEHRKEIKNYKIELWLVKNNFPEGFQIMCMNCNWGKGLYGKCPHFD